MAYDIHANDHSIIVEFHDTVTLDNIKQAIVDEFSREEFPRLNSIWKIGDQRLALHFEDLREITDFVMALYPKQATRTKTAIVADEGLSSSFVELWVDLAQNLPYKNRVFHDIAEATEWINSPD